MAGLCSYICALMSVCVCVCAAAANAAVVVVGCVLSHRLAQHCPCTLTPLSLTHTLHVGICIEWLYIVFMFITSTHICCSGVCVRVRVCVLKWRTREPSLSHTHPHTHAQHTTTHTLVLTYIVHFLSSFHPLTLPFRYSTPRHCSSPCPGRAAL